MSDILIKGMKMPKKGHFLFQISANGDVWVSNRNDEGTGIITAKAIELPPYGELIERDKILEYIEDHETLNIGTLYDVIQDAPTVLEAST